MTKTAIYHFTDKSEKRPKIYRNQIEALKDFSVSVSLDVTDVYCDMSLKRCERTEFDRFLSCCEQYQALVTKDFYHLSKNTGECMSILKQLREKGLQVFSVENGTFTWEKEPLDKPLRVATYISHFAAPSELKEVVTTQNDVFKLFARKKTNWTIVDQYSDESLHQNDSEQIQLKKLIANRDRYDLLLVQNLNDIHWRTANFCKIREQLQLDIYSLQEGFLKYRRSL